MKKTRKLLIPGKTKSPEKKRKNSAVYDSAGNGTDIINIIEC